MDSTHRGAQRAALLAIAGILVYILAIDAALRILEPQYSLLRNAESDYGNGAFALAYGPGLPRSAARPPSRS